MLPAALLMKKQGNPRLADRWRILVHAHTDSTVLFDEIYFRDTPGGPDLTTGDPATQAYASSVYFGSNAAEYAFDNTTSTGGWAAKTSDAEPWIAWIFDAPVEIVEVRWANGSSYAATDVSIQFSKDDGATWETSWRVSSGLATGSGAWNTITKP